VRRSTAPLSIPKASERIEGELWRARQPVRAVLCPIRSIAPMPERNLIQDSSVPSTAELKGGAVRKPILRNQIAPNNTQGRLPWPKLW
jgi:hypothetical protein